MKSARSNAFAAVLRRLAKALLDAADAIEPPINSPGISPALERAANRAYWIIVLRRTGQSFDALSVELQHLKHEIFRQRFPEIER